LNSTVPEQPLPGRIFRGTNCGGWATVPADTPPDSRPHGRPPAFTSSTDREDERLSCTITRDNDSLYTEDVIEMFLWPDEGRPLYFEYEISPLGFELPIIVPNLDGQFMGWLPWDYENERRIRKATGPGNRTLAPTSTTTTTSEQSPSADPDNSTRPGRPEERAYPIPARGAGPEPETVSQNFTIPVMG
jgi:hypothetical protein